MNPLTAVAATLVISSALAACQAVTGKSAPQHFTDKWLKHETKARLAVENIRTLTATSVDVNHGIVYLTGNVATPQQKAQAEAVAREVEGVRDVVNHLEVAAESSAKGSTRGSPSASPASGAPNR